MVLPRQPLDEVLHETVTKLKKLQQEKPKAALLIEEWCKNRQKTIDLIPILRESVKTICSRCNDGRKVGAAVSVGGLLTTVVGAILKWKGFPIGDQFLDGGKCLTATGTVVLATSNVAEACLTRDPTNRINEVIQKDIEMTEKIRKWIEFSHGVEHCFGRLLQCDIPSPNLVKIMKVLDRCIDLINAGAYEINNLIQDIRYGKTRKIGNITAGVGIEVIRCLLRIQNNPNIQKPLKEICEIACENPSLFQFVNQGVTLHLKACGIGIAPNFARHFFKHSNVLVSAFCSIKMVYDLVTNIKFQEIEKRKIAYFEALDEVTKALKSEKKEVENCLNEQVLVTRRPFFKKFNY
ncbi:hypothetical protein JTE90_009776 [Oedothorax gibbosus]|uniref:Uncharacterized protein n=1 Tax=Oedothorax gibbosus TaxID=931172 RepID=A0AAV6V903_9ARAC|nr:hypothetical protein JTE90_009776 [Oedothorax gibbosus]